MNIDKIRSQFPVLRNILFLNHAGTSPISSYVADKMAQNILDVCEFGSVHYSQWMESCKNTRKAFAQLIHVPTVDVAIMKNTTEAVNVLANGFPWVPGENVVITNAEYPANVYPWLNQASRGIEIRMVKERNGKIELNDIVSQVNDRTRIISVSFVEFASGYRNNLKAIGEFCKQKDIIFMVDAIQGLGVLEFNAEEFHVDAVTAGMHKWLLGPCGVGLFYCKKELLDKLKLWYVGADSVIDAENYLDYNLTLLPDARRLEYAMLNFTGIAGASAAFEFLFENGITEIQTRIKTLTDFLITELEKKGYVTHSPRGENEWSGIVCCYSQKYPSKDLYKLLKDNKIYTSVRTDRLRISPHYYNMEEDLLKVVSALPEH